MAVRPSAILQSIIDVVEAVEPHTDTDAARPVSSADRFRHYTGDMKSLNRERGFILEVDSAPGQIEDLSFCGWRRMRLRIGVSYMWTPQVYKRLADDSDALETALSALPTSAPAVQIVQIASELPVEPDEDGKRVLLEIPFTVDYDRS